MPPHFAPPGAANWSPSERAIALAQLARKTHATDVGISATAPTPGDGIARGTVVIGLSIADHHSTETIVLHPDHERMRNYAVISALDYLRKTIPAA